VCTLHYLFSSLKNYFWPWAARPVSWPKNPRPGPKMLARWMDRAWVVQKHELGRFNMAEIWCTRAPVFVIFENYICVLNNYKFYSMNTYTCYEYTCKVLL
jgi:hypothetical protein